jgi:hypothetical protein
MICLCTLKPGFGFQYSILPIISSSLLILGSLYNSMKVSKTVLTSFVLISANIILALMLLSENHVKEASGLVLILGTVLYLKTMKHNRLDATLTLCLYVISFATFIQIFYPILWSNAEIIFTRAPSLANQGARGVSALAPEPSFMVLQLLAIFICKLYLRTISKLDFLLIIILTFITFSLFGIIILMFVMILSDSVKFKVIGPLLSAALVVHYFFPFDIEMKRSLSLIKLMLENGPIILMNDTSVSSRSFYILKDLLGVIDNSFMPIGPGNYYLISSNAQENLTSFLHPEYNPTLAGSYLGYWIYQYGILAIIGVAFFIVGVFGNLRQITGSSVKSLVGVLLLFIVMFQMISIIYSPFAFIVGFLIFHCVNHQKLSFSDAY